MHRKARRHQKNHEILFGVHPVREAILQKKRNFQKLYLNKTKGSNKRLHASVCWILWFYSNKVFESFFFSAELLHEQDALQREFHDFFDGVELFYASLKNHEWRNFL